MDSILIIGRRSSGKTTLIKDLLQHSNHSIAHVFNTKDSRTDEYADVPNVRIHEEYSEPLLRSIVEPQRECVQSYQRGEKSTSTVPHIAIAFDNCMHDNEWHKHADMKVLFVNGRCLKMKHIIALPHPMHVPTSMRCNIDYVFIFRETDSSNLGKLHTDYASMFPTIEEFHDALESITSEPNACMVINHAGRSDRLEDMVFTYRAQV